jgi:hypothetical protein
MKWNLDDNDEIREAYNKAGGPEIHHEDSDNTGVSTATVAIAVLGVIDVVLIVIWSIS